MHKNCTGHSAQIARGKLRGRCPWKPANLPWYNKVKSKITLESLFLQPFHTRERGNTMSRFQAGALVVYGNLGVHEVEGVGLRRFCDESAREYYTLRPYFSDSHDRSYIPTAKEGALRPVPPSQQAEADLARIKEVRSCRKSNGISKRSNESGWLFSGRCVSDTPSCLGENPGRAT